MDLLFVNSVFSFDIVLNIMIVLFLLPSLIMVLKIVPFFSFYKIIEF
jgi:hypothetical protein